MKYLKSQPECNLEIKTKIEPYLRDSVINDLTVINITFVKFRGFTDDVFLIYHYTDTIPYGTFGTFYYYFEMHVTVPSLFNYLTK